MANSGKMNTGSTPRLLQLGLDKQIDHFMRNYKGMGDMVFKTINHDKGFFEAAQFAGMGLAALKGEGEPISLDSIDQDWVYRWTVYTYAKAARITMEQIQDQQYEELLPKIGQQQGQSLADTRDTLQANVLNGLFAAVGPDGQYLADNDHPIQAGGTGSNLASAATLSEDAIEQLVILADRIKNPNGIVGNYQTQDLIVPTALRFEADRIVNSKYRSSSADNDISAIYSQNVIKRVLPWKRLSSNTAFFLTTDAKDGFTCVRRSGVQTDSFKEPTTLDVIVTAYERYVNALIDWRGVVANAGA